MHAHSLYYEKEHTKVYMLLITIVGQDNEVNVFIAATHAKIHVQRRIRLWSSHLLARSSKSVDHGKEREQ